jgi:hypothetical protein
MIICVAHSGPSSGKPPCNQPARDGGASGSWPPFQPGHEITLRHGARSDPYVEPLARAFADVLITDRPDLAGYPEAVAAWATAEARCEKYRRWHADVGFVDGDGNVRGGANVLAYENQAQRMRERLGLDPLADAQLAKTRSEAVLSAVDLESIRQRGREAFARRETAALAGTAAAEAVEGEAGNG